MPCVLPQGRVATFCVGCSSQQEGRTSVRWGDKGIAAFSKVFFIDFNSLISGRAAPFGRLLKWLKFHVCQVRESTQEAVTRFNPYGVLVMPNYN